MNGAPGPLRLLIVDDEALARARLRDLVRDLAAERAEPAVEIVGEAATAAEAIAWLEARPCDLVLLDIGMPGVDGLGLARVLQRLARPPAVVFVTAHAEHAVAAFDLEAVDYLTKPVRRERLRAALARVARRQVSAASAPTVAGGGAAGSAPDVVVVADRGRIVRVPVGEVLYFKAELKYVTLRTASHAWLIDDALADLEARFGERFLRVHRNALVARRAMRALERRPTAPPPGERDDEPEGWAVQVAPVGDWLAVSRRQLAAVRESLGAA